jgi:hypothetical protein
MIQAKVKFKSSKMYLTLWHVTGPSSGKISVMVRGCLHPLFLQVVIVFSVIFSLRQLVDNPRKITTNLVFDPPFFPEAVLYPIVHLL